MGGGLLGVWVARWNCVSGEDRRVVGWGRISFTFFRARDIARAQLKPGTEGGCAATSIATAENGYDRFLASMRLLGALTYGDGSSIPRTKAIAHAGASVKRA